MTTLNSQKSKIPAVFDLYKTVCEAKDKAEYKAELFVKQFEPLKKAEKSAKQKGKSNATKIADGAKASKIVKAAPVSKETKTPAAKKTTAKEKSETKKADSKKK